MHRPWGDDDPAASEYGYNHTDALLVLKDILARVWKASCKKQ